MVKTFLLADDDPDDVAIFREALFIIDPNIVFYFANNGRVALEKLGDKDLEEPDIIFLDINMPVMNGWECLTKLKLSESYNDIPVIIYSTASYKREIEKAFDLGALCFFTKPTDFKELIINLRAISDNLDKDMPPQIGHLKGISCKDA
jgi:CheY-like chemotaxis protein